METLLRQPKGSRKVSLFAAFVIVSLLAHALLLWFFLAGRPGRGGAPEGGVAARFSDAVSSVTELEKPDRDRAEKALARVKPAGWTREALPTTLRSLGKQVGVELRRCEVLPSLDPERAREGRWDIRADLRWAPGSDTRDMLALVFLVGEATLKSRFGSHRFWLHVEGSDGAGRVAFETMDCRLYRVGKLSAADLLHRAKWMKA